MDKKLLKLINWSCDIYSELSDSYVDGLLEDVLCFLGFNNLLFDKADETFCNFLTGALSLRFDEFMLCNSKEDLSEFFGKAGGYILMHDNSELTMLDYFG